MAACAACGTTILFGGVKAGDMRFCNANCHAKGSLLLLAQRLPPDLIQQKTTELYHGSCPKCQGPGPVDVHTSYRIWSALLLTSWHSLPHVCCRGCGVKNQLGDALFCLLLGWWGFPWGLVMTPVQISRNVAGMLRSKHSDAPSPDLQRVVGLMLASHAAAGANLTR